MRVSKQEMAKNRAKIIDEAARMFREQGIEKTSVTDVMNAAGLTHGGFYRHFQSKDELVNAALTCTFNTLGNELKNNMAQKGANQAVAEFIKRYLSEQHADNPGKGCPIAALAIETARRPDLFQATMTRGTGQLIDMLAEGLDGKPEEKRLHAIGLLNLLVGSLIMARSAENRLRRNEILAAGYLLAQNYLR